jgi:archaellum component FlaC
LTEKVARLDAFIEGFREDIRQLRDEIAKLDAKIDRVRDELDAKIDRVRDELEAKIEKTRGELREEIGELREEIRELRMVMIGGFIAVIAVSILLKLLLG